MIYTPYIWPYIITIFLNLFISFYLLKNRSRNGAGAFICTLLFCTLWCAGSLMELSVVSVPAKIFWTKMAYPAYAFSPVAWFVMVLRMTDRPYGTNWRKIGILCIIPVITAILAWTNDFHHWIWYGVLPDMNQLPHTIVLEHGWWFWVHAVYSDGLNLLSIILTIWFWRNKAPLYSRQFKYLAFSMLFVMFVNAAYVMKIGPHIDATPIAWGVASLFIAWALFRNKLFDLMPIARTRVMENMPDGIIVIDIKDRIADINPAASQIFRHGHENHIGDGIASFFEGWPVLQTAVAAEKEYSSFTQIQDGLLRYYEALCHPIQNERAVTLGRLLIIRDVTEKKMTELALLEKRQEIAVKEERERLARDVHDNIAQILGFVNVQAQAIQEYLKRGQAEIATECLERLTEVAQEAHSNVREAILAMREDINAVPKEKSNFFNELNHQIVLLEKHHQICAEIDIKIRNSFNMFTAETAEQLLNIFKEALNNIAKHSHADAVKITFTENADRLHIAVADNGQGFSRQPGAELTGKYGLLFMKERAKEIGASLEIQSESGHGTTVHIELPFAPQELSLSNSHEACAAIIS